MKRNISFYVHDISSNGGMENMCITLANHFMAKNNVHIYTKCYGDPKFKLSNGVAIKKINNILDLHLSLKNDNADILICVGVETVKFCLLPALLSNVRIISWEHFNFNTSSLWGKIWKLSSCVLVNATVVLTEKDRNNYPSFIKNKVKTIYNFLNSESEKEQYIFNSTNKKNRTKVVLAVGRLVDQKGFDLLLNSWGLLTSNDKNNFILKIVGDGDSRIDLEKKIKDNKLTNVELHPFSKNIDRYYREADLYVMSSRFEGLPMVLIEASYFGLPIVSFDCVTGPSDIIENGVNGYLVEPFNCLSMADKIKEIITDENKISLMSENSRKIYFSKFSKEKITNKWDELVEGI